MIAKTHEKKGQWQKFGRSQRKKESWRQPQKKVEDRKRKRQVENKQSQSGER